MPVANSQRCEHVDPETGKRCGRRATYLNSEGQWCEGYGHDPAYPEDEINEDAEVVEMEVDDQIPDDFDAEVAGMARINAGEDAPEYDFDAALEELTKLAEAMKKQETQPESASMYCQCGCGEPVAKGRIYEQGHDQRHKGILMRAAIAGDDDAMRTLVRKGWRTREYVIARRTQELEKQERKIAKLNRNKPAETTVIVEFEAL